MTYDGQSDIVVLIIGDGSRVDRDRVPALEAKTDREVQATVLLPVGAGQLPRAFWVGLAAGAPCGAQGSNLMGAKVDGSKVVLIRTGRLTRPLPIIRGITESPAIFLR